MPKGVGPLVQNTDHPQRHAFDLHNGADWILSSSEQLSHDSLAKDDEHVALEASGPHEQATVRASCFDFWKSKYETLTVACSCDHSHLMPSVL